MDVSEAAVRACRSRHAGDDSKTFLTLDDYKDQKAELSLSLDVIYHLVEDPVYEAHMAALFDAGERFVIVYASNRDGQARSRHVRHRKFTDWVAVHRPHFRLTERVPNRYPFDPQNPRTTSFADFYVFVAEAMASASGSAAR